MHARWLTLTVAKHEAWLALKHTGSAVLPNVSISVDCYSRLCMLQYVSMHMHVGHTLHRPACT